MRRQVAVKEQYDRIQAEYDAVLRQKQLEAEQEAERLAKEKISRLYTFDFSGKAITVWPVAPGNLPTHITNVVKAKEKYEKSRWNKRQKPLKADDKNETEVDFENLTHHIRSAVGVKVTKSKRGSPPNEDKHLRIFDNIRTTQGVRYTERGREAYPDDHSAHNSTLRSQCMSLKQYASMSHTRNLGPDTKSLRNSWARENSPILSPTNEVKE